MFRSVRTRVITTFVVAMCLLLVASFFVGFFIMRWTVYQVSDENGLAAAQACADTYELMIDKDGEIQPNDAKYEDNRSYFRALCLQAGMNFMYIFKCDPDNKTITYIYSVAADDAMDSRVRQELGYGTVIDYKPSETMLRALRGEDVKEALVIDNQFGNMISWFSLVEGTNGTVLAGADYSIDAQRATVFRAVALVILPLIGALVILMLIELKVLSKHVFTPLSTISRRMREFSAERASNFEPLGIESKDEIGEIAEAFEGMAKDIDASLKDIEHMTEERVQADVELGVAQRIQFGIVPERSDFTESDFNVSAVAQPAREVGGDFYDLIEFTDGRVGIVVGDVSGKGVAGALFMAMAKTMIRDHLIIEESPAAALNKVNESLCSANPEGMFVTVVAAVCDPLSGEVSFANAGHMPPLAIGERGRVIEADPGILLGLFDDVALEDVVFTLGEGEALLLYTDGVTEAINPEGNFLGTEGLMAGMNEHAPFANACEVIDAVIRVVVGFTKEREQFDDVTAAALMRCERADGMAGFIEIAPEATALQTIREAIMACSGDETRKRKACLACEEAFANIVAYSGAGHAWYSVREKDGYLRLVLVDDGKAFNPLEAEKPRKDFEDLDTGGMGISLFCELSHEVAYEREEGKNKLTLVL